MLCSNNVSQHYTDNVVNKEPPQAIPCDGSSFQYGCCPSVPSRSQSIFFENLPALLTSLHFPIFENILLELVYNATQFWMSLLHRCYLRSGILVIDFLNAFSLPLVIV